MWLNYSLVQKGGKPLVPSPTMLMWDGWAKSKPVMKWKWHKGWPTNLSGALDQVSGSPRQPVKQTWCCGGREGTAEWRSDKTMLFCALIRRLVFLSVTRSWSSSFDTGCTFKPFQFGCFTPEKCRQCNSNSASPPECQGVEEAAYALSAGPLPTAIE